MNKYPPPAYYSAALISLVLCLASASSASFQQEPDRTRHLWDSDFFKTQSKKTSPAKRRYRIATPKVSPHRVNGNTVIGITLWRLRPSTVADDKRVRLLKHTKDNTNVVEWTPERINTETPLALGQRVRLSIEAAREGYLYVIDRELFSDGSMGDPYLIFPTLSIRNGDNRIGVGRLIDIPDLIDNPNYFTLKPTETGRPGQIGEMLTVVVAPKPLDEIKLEEKEVIIPKEILANWEKSWGSNIGRMDLENASGKAWSKEERESAANQRPLQDNNPVPQSIFYRPDAKADEPLLANVRLRYGKMTKSPRVKN